MIVSFSVDPEALALPELDHGTRLAVHKRLLIRWRRQGILVFPGPRLRDSPLHREIALLPTDIRKLWKETLVSSWRLAVDGLPDLAQVHSADQMQSMRGVISLACLDPTRAACVGLPHDKTTTHLPTIDLEICCLECVDASKAFTDAEDLSHATIELGTAVEDLWRDRFARLAQMSRNIVIVDRYAAQRHARNPKRSGLRRLLANLSDHGPAVTVKLCSEMPDEMNPSAIEGSLAPLMAELLKGRIREFRVSLAPNTTSMRLAHDRYIRFDDKLVTIGIGLEVLEGSHVKRRTSCQLRPFDAKSRDSEERLFASASVAHSWSQSFDNQSGQ